MKLINVVRRHAQIEELKARYGADIHVVAFDGSNENEALAQVNAITENKGVKYGKLLPLILILGKFSNASNLVFEAVSGKTFDFALKALAQHGHLLSFGALSGTFNVQVFIGLLLAKTPKIEGTINLQMRALA